MTYAGENSLVGLLSTDEKYYIEAKYKGVYFTENSCLLEIERLNGKRFYVSIYGKEYYTE
ncbi:MAG: hypothetical protein SGJ10_03500 [Bacteroidota bacterium]|nr:hypothetical protein [Bacteroidota bacterium]